METVVKPIKGGRAKRERCLLMQLPTPQAYGLQLRAQSNYEVLLESSTQSGFSGPATLICPKLYVVMRKRDIHYVGVTNRPMAARINLGLKAKGKGGYHGYKWKGIRDPLKLLVWSFTNQNVRELETVEAEFAFLVRRTTGDWPLSQTEIHFYPATPAHLAAASAMYIQCSNRAIHPT